MYLNVWILCQYLSFDSYHPVAHKVAVVRTLMTRVDALSSSGLERAQEEKEVAAALKENGFHSGSIHRHSCRDRPRPLTDDLRLRTSVTQKPSGGFSGPSTSRLCFMPRTPSTDLHPKYLVITEEWKGVVYSIPCTDCPKVGIGQTGRCLKLKLEEYCRALRNRDVAASAIAEHTLSTGHGMDLTKSTVLDCHSHTTTKSREALTTSTENEEHSHRSTRLF